MALTMLHVQHSALDIIHDFQDYMSALATHDLHAGGNVYIQAALSDASLHCADAHSLLV